MRAMATDLAEGSPAGRLYGETLGNALAVYSLKPYTVRRRAPVAYQGGLPGYRLRRVLDYIGDNLSDDLSLSELASVAGMSAHYFAELFRESTGHSPHRYVLLRSIDHAKQSLCERGTSVIEAALAAGLTIRAISPACFENSWAQDHQRFSPRWRAAADKAALMTRNPITRKRGLRGWQVAALGHSRPGSRQSHFRNAPKTGRKFQPSVSTLCAISTKSLRSSPLRGGRRAKTDALA